MKEIRDGEMIYAWNIFTEKYSVLWYADGQWTVVMEFKTREEVYNYINRVQQENKINES